MNLNAIESGLLTDKDMSEEFESENVEVFPYFNRSNYKLCSIMISYYNVSALSGGIPNGKIEILGSNNQEIWSKIASFKVDKEHNLDDAILFEDIKNVEFLKLKYSTTNIISGGLNASLLYTKWNLV